MPSKKNAVVLVDDDAGPGDVRLALEWLPVDDLHLDPANARKHPERSLAALKSSLARFGQQKPIVVDASNVVRAGNGTLEAARALGWDKIACVRTGLKGSEATAYAIADNKIASLSEWDDDVLAATIAALRDEDFDLAAVGFTDPEVEALCASLEEGVPVDDPDAEWGGMPECENEAQKPYRTLNVHFAAEEDVRRFAELIGQDIPPKAPSVWFPARRWDRPSRNPYVAEP